MYRVVIVLVVLIQTVCSEVHQFTNLGILKDKNDVELKVSTGNPLSNCKPNPCIADWDNDGDMDIIVGVWEDEGNILFFENSGTKNKPIIEKSIELKAGGTKIKLSAGWCIGASNPQVEDLNSDGLMDLIVGERDGFVNFYERKSDGSLESGIQLSDKNGVIKLGTNSSPELVDWNADGLLDLLLTSEKLGLYLYLNNGTKEKHKYVDKTEIKLKNSSMKYLRPQIQVADMNRDGLFDLIVGNGLVKESRIYYYENSGEIGKPQFSNVEEIKLTNGDVVDPHYDVHLGIGDWNGDGEFDIFYSDYKSNIFYLKGVKNTSIKFDNNSSIDNFKMLETSGLTTNLEDFIEVVDIYAPNGRKITLDFIEKNFNAIYSLSNSCLSPGVYFIHVKTNDSNRLIKVRK